MPRSRALSTMLVGLALTGCSENFGTAPVDNRVRVEVTAESFAGPLPPTRVVRSLAGTTGRLWLGLESGLYHVQPGGWHWLPGHPGYTPTNEPSLPSSIEAIDVSTDGRLAIHLARKVDTDYLFVSSDGGQSFEEVLVPNPIVARVDLVAALPPSVANPSGGFLVTQAGAVYLRQGDGAWDRATLPAVPARVVAAAANAQGLVVIGVDQNDGAPAVWRSDDGGVVFVSSDLTPRLNGRVLDVAVSSDGEIAVATQTGLLTETSALEFDASASRASLDFVGSQAHYAVLLEEAPAVQIGRLVEGDAPVRIDEPADVAALLVAGDTVFVATNPSADLWQWEGSTFGRHEFAGGMLRWTAIAADPREPGTIYLADQEGEVFHGDPLEEMTPLRRSAVAIPRALLADTGSSTGVFSGNSGVQLKPSNVTEVPWVDRSQGQRSYSLDNFEGPVNVQGLATAPDDGGHLWLGTVDNDGPYESLNGGFQWSRVHGGLGTPYSIPDESGLPGVTQVRAFVFPRDETWMGTYRGGIWSLDEGPTRTWRQRNQGLPALDGSPVDTCCFAPLDQQIDVRDLVEVQSGTLLAATGWGVYRDDGVDGVWESSVSGLTNGDIFALAVHPDRTDWVLAAARGTSTNPDWLFLSRDAGRNWSVVGTQLRARFCEDVVWSDPSRLEIVAMLIGSGAWRMEILP